MAEHSMSVEIAHKLHENKHAKRADSASDLFEGRIEILEAFLLAVVAIATAWSGYQSARWDGHSAAEYAKASAYRVDGDHAVALGGQHRLHDVSTFYAWLDAKTNGNEKLAVFLERRFSNDYEPVFRSWLATDPFNNTSAPPGPAFMPEYKNHLVTEGAQQRHHADKALESAKSARETGEDYVRLTVFLATILFLVAIAQRFTHKVPRFGLLGIAAIAMSVTLVILATYPRA